MKFTITDIVLKICMHLVESKNQEIDIKHCYWFILL